jgi:hypothetical protein
MANVLGNTRDRANRAYHAIGAKICNADQGSRERLPLPAKLTTLSSLHAGFLLGGLIIRKCNGWLLFDTYCFQPRTSFSRFGRATECLCALASFARWCSSTLGAFLHARS